MQTRRINGDTVRVIRELVGLSSTNLAARVGVTVSTVSHLEAGSRQLSPEKTRAIAEALGVPLTAITYPVSSSEVAA